MMVARIARVELFDKAKIPDQGKIRCHDDTLMLGFGVGRMRVGLELTIKPNLRDTNCCEQTL
jgi:hypothetical protein